MPNVVKTISAHLTTLKCSVDDGCVHRLLYIGEPLDPLQADVIAQRTGLARLEGVVEGSKGPVLADEYAGLLPLDGRRIYLQPFEMTQLQRDGRWDQGPLLRSIRRRKFPVILIWKPRYAAGIERERWTRGMLEAIEENYEPAHTHAGTVVYRPKPDDGVS
jgi:hypothetical protein